MSDAEKLGPEQCLHGAKVSNVHSTNILSEHRINPWIPLLFLTLPSAWRSVRLDCVIWSVYSKYSPLFPFLPDILWSGHSAMTPLINASEHFPFCLFSCILYEPLRQLQWKCECQPFLKPPVKYFHCLSHSSHCDPFLMCCIKQQLQLFIIFARQANSVTVCGDTVHQIFPLVFIN